MRKKLIILLCLVGLVGIFALQWKAIQNPETNQRLVHLLRDTPDIIFWPVFVLITIPLWIGLCFRDIGITRKNSSVLQKKGAPFRAL